MRISDHLYVGKKAGENRFRIVLNLRFSKLQPEIYVITPASNGNNILDIYPSVVFQQDYYRDQDLLVLGVARGYDEALEVAGQIVNDMYQKTGGFSLQEFMDSGA